MKFLQSVLGVKYSDTRQVVHNTETFTEESLKRVDVTREMLGCGYVG